MNNFKYLKISNSEEALHNISNLQNSKFLAGGTNLIDLWKYDLLNPDTLIDINELQDLTTENETADGSFFLGALLTNAETAHHPVVEEKYPLLSRSILAGASAQIRNSATNGGNLLQKTRCYYFYDAALPCNKRNPGSGCPAIEGSNRMHAILGTSEKCIAVFPSDMCVGLAALEAVIQVKGLNGERLIKFEDFHTLPGETPEIDNTLAEDELITGIILPKEGFAENFSYLKLRDRSSYAFALISVATGLKLENGLIKKARIALGGIAHKPWRVKEAEDFLIDKKPDEENFRTAAEMIIKGAKGFGDNDFKIELSKKAIVRNCLMALDPTESQRPGAKPAL
ncbi:FAD binding domain-containing protein [Halpernia frigidisoli]|uniref:Xanthine dehydrogenase YagS FAD-binding subunit n=1 Tax=Halpernia frigidisoli TaxID=1125876 RepID=A0A1I3D6S7_9FLAO|nr:xanthine dehydrogenase family protein subunit M [Halpernia frigidisoli]SFH82279.1 xanthine dehydrogenase YagS FAD-binding subunit [Halpernia frigidisoli]